MKPSPSTRSQTGSFSEPAKPFPRGRTLDGIHLATALSIREIETVDLLLNHDSQLATAARGLGFEVIGTDQ